jgi:hypothetical protein
MRKVCINLIIVSLVILTISCKPAKRIEPKEAIKLIPALVEQFHANYNESKNAEIADTLFDPFYDQAARKEDIKGTLEFYFSRTGKALNATIQPEYKIAHQFVGDRIEITIITDVQFEKYKGHEFFVFVVGDDIKLLLYQIQDENYRQLLY